MQFGNLSAALNKHSTSVLLERGHASIMLSCCLQINGIRIFVCLGNSKVVHLAFQLQCSLSDLWLYVYTVS